MVNRPLTIGKIFLNFYRRENQSKLLSVIFQDSLSIFQNIQLRNFKNHFTFVGKLKNTYNFYEYLALKCYLIKGSW